MLTSTIDRSLVQIPSKQVILQVAVRQRPRNQQNLLFRTVQISAFKPLAAEVEELFQFVPRVDLAGRNSGYQTVAGCHELLLQGIEDSHRSHDVGNCAMHLQECRLVAWCLAGRHSRDQSRTITIRRRLASSSPLLRARNNSLRMATSTLLVLNCCFRLPIFSSKSSTGVSMPVSSRTSFSRVASSSSSSSSRMARRRPSARLLASATIQESSWNRGYDVLGRSGAGGSSITNTNWLFRQKVCILNFGPTLIICPRPASPSPSPCKELQ